MANDQNLTANPNSGGSLIHWAANYDRLLSVITLGMEGRFRRRIIESARLTPGQRVLYVGCGTGTLAIEAARVVGPDGRVDGIDPSREMIARARSKALAKGFRINFHEAGIESLPFPDHCFDAVLSSLMFHHLDRDLQQAGLSEIRRVLVPGGRLTIIDFSGQGPLLHRIAGHLTHHASDDPSHPGTTFEELEAEATRAGFQNVRSSGFKPWFLHRLSAESRPNV